jgi:ribosomal protein L22
MEDKDPDTIDLAQTEWIQQAQAQQSQNQEEKDMEAPCDMECKQATLAFFSNPTYFNTIQRAKLNIAKKDEKKYKEELKFYKKRIISLFKEIIKEQENTNNEDSTKEIKESHERFIYTCINHFKNIDKTDILQAQYGINTIENAMPNATPNAEPNADLDMDDLNIEGFTIDNVNEIMMKKTINVANLDNYVNIIPDLSANDTRIIPLRFEIDLRQPILKTKGVKTKVKKEKKQ